MRLVIIMLIHTQLNFMRTVFAQNITCDCPSSTTWNTSISSIIVTIVVTLLCNNCGCIKQFCIEAYEKCNTFRQQMCRLLETSVSTTATIPRRPPVTFLPATPAHQIEEDSTSETVPHHTVNLTSPCVIDMEK